MEGGDCKARIFGEWSGKVKQEVGSESGELGLNTGFDLGKWEVGSAKWQVGGYVGDESGRGGRGK